MIRAIAEIPLVIDAPSQARQPLVVTKTLFLAPAVGDGALIALVLCDDRAFRITRDGLPLTTMLDDLDDAIAIFRRTVRGR